MNEVPAGETIDTLFDGALEIAQPASGYRFSIDAVLLAGAAQAAAGGRVLDLGCGSGVVGLATERLWAPREVVGIECQSELAALARRNVERNQLKSPMRVLTGDVRHYKRLVEPNAFDVVVTNPPYYAVDQGRINPDAQRAVARHEVAGTLDDFLHAACYGLKPRGMCYLVYPAFRLTTLMASLTRGRLHPEWLQFVQPRSDEPATLTLCGARLGGSAQLVVRPPLIVHDDGGHSALVASLLMGRRLPYPGERS